MIKKNDRIRVSITDVTNLGYGVAKYNGETVFVRDTVTGDEAFAVIIKKYPTYAIAICDSLMKQSPYRCENRCASFPVCGGCSYRHIDYAYELELKRSYVSSCFAKEGLDIYVQPVMHTAVTAYRNKVQYPVAVGKDGRLYLGFFSEYSHRAVSSDGCLTEAACFSPVKTAITDLINRFGYSAYNEKNGTGLLRHVFLRCNYKGEVHVCFVINGTLLPRQSNFVSALLAQRNEIRGISLNINTANTNVILGEKSILLYGEEKLIDIMLGREFAISPQSFWQINRDTAEALYAKGKELLALDSGDVLLDLYCGIGSIGLSIADKSTRLFGVEVVHEAVEDAVYNAKRNGFSDASFICGDARIGFSECREKFGSIDAVIVDPPRKGISAEVIGHIVDSAVSKVLYISCNPATLARDVKTLSEMGYVADIAYPFDMFPRTGHVETVLLLKKVKSDI